MSNSYNLRLTSILDPRVRAGQPAEETREQTRGEKGAFDMIHLQIGEC